MKKYDVFGLSQLIERGLARKLELIENAITQLDPALEPITVLEPFAFVVNTNNAQMYRINYEVSEGMVKFTNPMSFEIDTDTTRFDRNSGKIVRNIVEALADKSDAEVDFFKGQWFANQRQKKLLESVLDISVGIRTKHISNAKKIVTEAINSTRGAKGLIFKGRKTSKLGTLLSEGAITIVEKEPVKVDEERSRRQLIYSKIVEARNSARSLVDSPVFVDYAASLYNGIDVNESIEFIAQNYQELFTLSLSEQTEIFYAICEKKVAGKPDVARIVECIMGIGQYAVSDKEIAKDLADLSHLVGADENNYHSQMQVVEDEINARSFTINDLKILQNVLEGIIAQPSEFLAPEFVVEARRALRRLTTMMESGNVDDATVSATISLVSQFYPTTIGEDKKEDKKGKEDEENDRAEEDPNAEKTIYSEEVDSQTGFPKGTLQKILEKKKDHTPSDDPAAQSAEADELQTGLGIGKKKADGEDKPEAPAPEGDDDASAPDQEEGDKDENGMIEFKRKNKKANESVEELYESFKGCRGGKCSFDQLQDYKDRLKKAKVRKGEEDRASDLDDEIETEMLIAK